MESAWIDDEPEAQADEATGINLGDDVLDETELRKAEEEKKKDEDFDLEKIQAD